MAKENKSASGKLKDIGFLGELWQQVRLVYYLIKDGDVPIYLKVLPLAGVLYALFPIDLITDIVPVLGQLDDLTLLLIGAKVFIEMAPPEVVARYMDEMRAQTSTTIVEGEAADVEPEVKLIEGAVDDVLASLKTEEAKPKLRLFRRQGK